jgi:hypothetical protein
MYVYICIHTYMHICLYVLVAGRRRLEQQKSVGSHRLRARACARQARYPGASYSISIYIYMYMCVCVCVCVYVCVCVCVRVCVYIDALSLLHGFCALCPVSLAPSPRRTLSHSFHASLNALYYSVG